jgi:alpha-tubulin suppressor-like RCC1 family protein
MGVDLDGKVFSWGLNEKCRIGPTRDINEIFTPTQLIPEEAYVNEGLKAIDISCGSFHSMVLFENEKKEHHLYSVGISGG